MLFYSYFKTLVGKEVTVELKNDLAIAGTLHSVDQYLNIKLNNIRVINEQRYPHMVGDSQATRSYHATLEYDCGLFPSSFTLPFFFSKLVSDISFAAEISEELLHQRISGALPPATSKQCGCGAAS